MKEGIKEEDLVGGWEVGGVEGSELAPVIEALLAVNEDVRLCST